MDTDIAVTIEDGIAGAAPVPVSGDVALVRISGELGSEGGRRLLTELEAVLRTHPRVVADVSGVVLTHSASVHVFADALERAGGWPAAVLVLALPAPTLSALLEHSHVSRRVPTFGDLATALARVGERPELVRAWWHFEVDPHAPREARSYVRQVCSDWSIDDEACEAAEIVVTELVTNAVEHAASPSVVEVTRVPGSFRMTVRDFVSEPLPDPVLPPPHSVRGRGLAMVAAVSRAWGVQTHADGKTVWSELAV